MTKIRPTRASAYILLMVLGFFATLALSPSASAGSLPIRSSGNNLPLQPLDQPAPSGAARFLRLRGQAQDVKPAEVLEEIEALFIQPLYGSGNQILFSYTAQAKADGSFFLNLVLEPAMADDVGLINTYVSEREPIGFHDSTVRFERVIAFLEVAQLQAHPPAGEPAGGAGNSLAGDFELQRNFAFMSLRSWKSFANNMTSALRGQRRDFVSYLEQFVADAREFSFFKTEVLAKSTAVSIEPKAYLILENNASIGPSSDESPFLSKTPYRNCLTADHGPCSATTLDDDVLARGDVRDTQRSALGLVTDARVE